MSKITYADKSAINVNPEVADINKVNASDMNEIKTVVNDNNTAFETLSTTLTPIELYNNTSGATGSITLNDDVENYSYIEIFYRNNNSLYSSNKFYSPSGKQLTLSIMYPDSSSNQIWVQSTTKTITGKNMTNVSGRYAEAEVYSQAGFGRNDRIYIVRILGYK